jgi:hypothetical protein
MGFFTDIAVLLLDIVFTLITLSSINDGIDAINISWNLQPTLRLVNLNGPGCAFALTPAKPVAFGFIRNPAHVICVVDIENILWAHLDAGPAGGAQVFVYNYCLIHFGTPLFNTS